jgi:hypothetical protein
MSINIHPILFFTQRGFDEVHFETRFLNTLPFGRFVLAFQQQKTSPMRQGKSHMKHLPNVFEHTAFHCFSTGS